MSKTSQYSKNQTLVSCHNVKHLSPRFFLEITSKPRTNELESEGDTYLGQLNIHNLQPILQPGRVKV